jgi:hypothetical protein
MLIAVQLGMSAQTFIDTFGPQVERAREIVAGGNGSLEFSIDPESNNPRQEPRVDRIDFTNDDMEDRSDLAAGVWLADWIET